MFAIIKKSASIATVDQFTASCPGEEFRNIDQPWRDMDLRMILASNQLSHIIGFDFDVFDPESIDAIAIKTNDTDWPDLGLAAEFAKTRTRTLPFEIIDCKNCIQGIQRERECTQCFGSTKFGVCDICEGTGTIEPFCEFCKLTLFDSRFYSWRFRLIADFPNCEYFRFPTSEDSAVGVRFDGGFMVTFSDQQKRDVLEMPDYEMPF